MMRSSHWKETSICVPLAPGETAGSELRNRLKAFRGSEIFWGAPGPSRAVQLNRMSLRSRRRYLWHLHADSRLDGKVEGALASDLARPGVALRYFNLRFDADGPPWTALNAMAANLRSEALHLPFGDQGFFVERAEFFRTGAYDAGLSFGEDLDWALRSAILGLRQRRIAASLSTSARKYRRMGWAKTTLAHVGHTVRLSISAGLHGLTHTRRLRPGLAAFVKTPGMSPLKTRLAAGVGRKRASRLYGACLALMDALLTRSRESGLFQPYWAVAEKEGLDHPLWREHTKLWSGLGSLAERQHQVYSRLMDLHGSACLIGSDAPQMSSELLLTVWQSLQSHDFVLIPALDGGYTLVAGKKSLPASLWNSVPMSSPRTFELLSASLLRRGRLAVLAPMRDLDHSEDLEGVRKAVLASARAVYDLTERRTAAGFLKISRP